MRKRKEKYSKFFKTYKKELFRGDLKVIHKRVSESDSSITYEMVKCAFNDRPVAEEKIVKIKDCAEWLYNKRKSERQAAL